MAALRERFIDRLDRAGAFGATIALLRDGELAVSSGVGHRDPGRTDRIGDDDRTYLYSVTKPLIATIAMQLVDEGKLALDEPPVPPFPHPPLDPRITLRHLLGHTAGLPDYGNDPQYHADLKRDPARPWDSDTFWRRCGTKGAAFEPGTGWAYSNVGYMVVRAVLEGVAGMPFAEIVETRIARPLDLRHTRVATSLDDAAELTPGYGQELNDDGMLENIAPRYHPGWVSHGVIISSAAEAAVMMDAILSARIVSRNLLAEMRRATPVDGDQRPFVRPGYGLGLMTDDGNPMAGLAGHAGGGPGYSIAAYGCASPAGERLTAVALVNRGGLRVANEIAFDLLRDACDRP